MKKKKPASPHELALHQPESGVHSAEARSQLDDASDVKKKITSAGRATESFGLNLGGSIRPLCAQNRKANGTNAAFNILREEVNKAHFFYS